MGASKGPLTDWPRKPTLGAAAEEEEDLQPTKNKSKQTLVPMRDVDERESQQQGILAAVCLMK